MIDQNDEQQKAIAKNGEGVIVVPLKDSPEKEMSQLSKEKKRCCAVWTCREVLFVLSVLMGYFVTKVLLVSVNTYAGDLVYDFRVVSEKAKVGYFSGAISGVFNLGEMGACLLWPRVSDYTGRRPAMVVCIVFSGVIAGLTAFAHNYPYVLILRLLNGLCSGAFSLATITFGENPYFAQSQRHFAFGAIAGMWALVGIIFPFIGGSLARPTIQYWEWFLDGRAFGFARDFLMKFPYFLPNFVGFLIHLLALLVVVLWMYETNPKILRDTGVIDEEAKDGEERGLLESEESIDLCGLPIPDSREDEQSQLQKHPTRFGDRLKTFFSSQIFTKSPMFMLSSYLLASLVGLSLSSTIPVLLTFNLIDGGFQLTVLQIGLVGLSEGIFSGLTSILFSLFGRKVNPIWILRILPFLLLPFVATYPELYYLRNWQTSMGQALFWFLLVLYQLIRSFIIQVIYSVNLVLLDNSVDPKVKSKYFSLVTFLGAIAKGAGPFLGSLLLSAGASLGFFPFDLHFGFLLSLIPLLAVSLMGWLASLSLKEQYSVRTKNPAELNAITIEILELEDEDP